MDESLRKKQDKLYDEEESLFNVKMAYSRI
jgi:hypothetical protein